MSNWALTLRAIRMGGDGARIPMKKHDGTELNKKIMYIESHSMLISMTICNRDLLYLYRHLILKNKNQILRRLETFDIICITNRNSHCDTFTALRRVVLGSVAQITVVTDCETFA